jgi:hypothetical protein
VAVLEAAGPGEQLATADSNRSQLHLLANEPAAAIEWGRRAQQLAGRLGDTESSIHAAVNMNTARLTQEHPAAAAAPAGDHVRAVAAGLVDHAARPLPILAAIRSTQLSPSEHGSLPAATAAGQSTTASNRSPTPAFPTHTNRPTNSSRHSHRRWPISSSTAASA